MQNLTSLNYKLKRISDRSKIDEACETETESLRNSISCKI